MYSVEEKIQWFAISSRCFVFALQCIANYLIADHEPNVFEKPLINVHHDSVCEKILNIFTEGLTRWDAQYFLHIAEYGYTYENTLAFFPLYPLVVRSFAYAFQFFANNLFYITSLSFVLSTHHSLILMALIINNVLFIHCAILLYKLTFRVLKNERIAYFSAILFCLNPASIFFSAAYSETLFCFLTLNCLLNLETGHLFTGSVLCGLSAMTRSNGLLNIGYIIYRIIISRRSSVLILLRIFIFFSCLFLAVLPFILHQLYCYTRFCLLPKPNLPDFILDHSQRNNYLIPGNRTVWCDYFVPFSYQYVQNHYWGVGYLKYYEIKQIPNFILAFPVISISLYGALKFVQSHRLNLLYLGLVPSGSNFTVSSACLPYVLHMFALTIFSTLFMHVQVSTRLIFSSCPALFWFCAEFVNNSMSESKEEVAAKKVAKSPNLFYETQVNKKSKWRTLLLTERFLNLGLLIRYYFFAYFLAGPIIFSNNLPWT